MGIFKNKSYFYHSHVRRIISVFGYVFSDIAIARFNSEGKIERMISPVPIRFANEDFDLALNRDKVNSKDYSRVSSGFREEFPRMTYTLDNIQYNPDRAHSRNSKIRWTDNKGKLRSVESSVPYIANFTLNIICENHMDALQAFEQISVAFRPSITVKIKDYPVESCRYDLPISLTGVSINDNFDTSIEEKRRVIYSIEFEVMFHMYGPTGNGIEYEALIHNLRQASGCDTLDSNDIDGLRGRSSKIDSLINEYSAFESDDDIICEICLNFSSIDNKLIDTETGFVCPEIELSEYDTDAISIIETEEKLVSKKNI